MNKNIDMFYLKQFQIYQPLRIWTETKASNQVEGDFKMFIQKRNQKMGLLGYRILKAMDFFFP